MVTKPVGLTYILATGYSNITVTFYSHYSLDSTTSRCLMSVSVPLHICLEDVIVSIFSVRVC